MSDRRAEFMGIIEAGVRRLPEMARTMQAAVDAQIAAGAESVGPELYVCGFNGRSMEIEFSLLTLMVPFTEHEDKHRAMRGAGAMCQRDKLGPIAVMFRSEAWASKEAGPGGKYAEPSLDPGRKECVILSGGVLDRSAWHLSRRFIHRDASRRVVADGGWWTAPPDADIEVSLLASFWFGYYKELEKRYGQ